MRRLPRTVAAIASRQHGVVTRQELLAAALSASAIDRLIRAAYLFRVYPGVYRVGHRAASVEATYLAAVKACGPGAVLTGFAAAYLYGLVRGEPPKPSVATPKDRRIRGIAITRALRAGTVLRGIPIATVPEILVDLAAELDLEDLARACHEAGVRYRTTPRHVDATLARRPNASGAANLRAVMRGDAHVTLSKLERAFIALLKKRGLPLPITNRVASGRRVDCRWPEYRLTVELVSYIYHGSRHAWERDHVRAREAYAREDDFRSYTYRDVVEEPARMLAELRLLLAAPPAS
jgi:hypothetical protein